MGIKKSRHGANPRFHDGIYCRPHWRDGISAPEYGQYPATNNISNVVSNTSSYISLVSSQNKMIRLFLLIFLCVALANATCKNIRNKLRCNAHKYPRCVWQGSLCTHAECVMGVNSDRDEKFCRQNCQRAVFDCRCKSCWRINRAKECRQLSQCCLWWHGKCQPHFKTS